MKNLIIISTFFLCACSQLMQGQQQPVTYKNLKEKIMFTTCSGSVEDWGSCNNKARNACPSGYDVIKRHETAINGTREITFKCH
jgi:hypothetical protein